jgi:hypothetical protein
MRKRTSSHPSAEERSIVRREKGRLIQWDEDIPTGNCCIRSLRKKHRVELGPRQYRRLRRQWEFRYRKPRPVIALALQAARKYSASWPRMKQSLCGPRMRCTFNNTGRGVGCGFRRSSKILCCSIIPRARALAYFGAVCLRDGKFIFAREDNRFDTNFARALKASQFLRFM